MNVFLINKSKQADFFQNSFFGPVTMTEVGSDMLLHTSTEYKKKFKNPDIGSLIKIPDLPSFELKPEKRKGKQNSIPPFRLE